MLVVGQRKIEKAACYLGRVGSGGVPQSRNLTASRGVSMGTGMTMSKAGFINYFDACQ